MLVVQLGKQIIANTWCNHCQQLYNSVNNGGNRDKFYNRFMNETASSSNNSPIIVIMVTLCNRADYYIFALLVINSNLPPILHSFRDIAFDRSKLAIFGYPSCV